MKKSSTLGFTLLEILVVLLLLALLCSLALPAWHRVSQIWQQRQAINLTYDALQFARLQAVQHQYTTYFCLTRPDKKCVSHNAKGFIIFYYDKHGKLIVLKSYQFQSDILWRWQGLAAGHRIGFNPWGGSTANGHLSLQNAHNQWRKIAVSYTGRVHLTEGNGA